MNQITIREVLDYMDSAQPFSCRVVAYNRRRRTGGQILEYSEAIIATAPTGDEEAREGRPLTNLEGLAAAADERRRNPNHSYWYTRNIRLLQNGYPTSEIRKIHPPLMLEFCGKTVVP